MSNTGTNQKFVASSKLSFNRNCKFKKFKKPFIIVCNRIQDPDPEKTIPDRGSRSETLLFARLGGPA
jgi:hypothetical protein